MASIAHPFLLKLEYAFESRSYIGFCMEYCAGGELFYHLRSIKKMDEETARFYFVEICLGIDYLHKRYFLKFIYYCFKFKIILKNFLSGNKF